MNAAADFPRLLALFFTERLMRQRQASPHTIASYRTTFRLLVRYAQRVLNKPPSAMTLDDFDTALLGDFLSHLETDRGNDPRTRNTRLAAIRSFFRFVALQEPRYAALAQRVLAIPDKRYTRRPVAYLDRDEIEALLRALDPRTRTGRRDRTLLLVAVHTRRRPRQGRVRPRHQRCADAPCPAASESSTASARNFKPRAPMTLRTVSRLGLRSPESAL